MIIVSIRKIITKGFQMISYENVSHTALAIEWNVFLPSMVSELRSTLSDLS
jgi:hypothetical protein